MPHTANLLGRCAAILLLVLTTHTAMADAGLKRCASVILDSERLACFDALAATGSDTRAAAPKAGTAVNPAVDPADPKNFGLTASQLHAAPPGPAAIQARIVNMTDGNQGHVIVVLDTGQTWNVLDSDGRVSVGDQVTIKRAALGSFTMYTPSHHIYKVLRLR